MIKIKPCKCGCEERYYDQYKAGGRWGVCLMCKAPYCTRLPVLRFGLTRNGAYKKAVKEWNRRNTNETI